MARVALDAMGGDHAPDETVAGAIDASNRGLDVVLVGDEGRLRDCLDSHGADLPIVPAADVISMHDDPARAIREKPDSSIVVATRLVKSGEADALISAGSTGATLAAAAVILRRLPGVLRPAIASVFPTPGNPIVLIDSGANPDCKAEHLAQFGIMGSLVAQIYLGLDRPRVGLLNIGEEPGKGRELERAAYDLLAEAPVAFIGNVEGRDIASNKADVLVTDGFTGNVVLKTAEGAVQLVSQFTKAALQELPPEDLAMMVPTLTAVQRRVNHEEHGGAHLVGTAGVVVIDHGSSSRLAIANSIAIAAEGAERGLVKLVAERLAV